MRRRWEGVHSSLVRSTITLQAEQDFRKVRAGERALARFESPSALISFLTDQEGDLDEKDLIYAALVRVIQSRGPTSDLATSILWLGLWPGLDAIYRRNLRFFRSVHRAPEDLVSEIGELLTSAVCRADLSRIHRPAATLVRNTERDLRERLRRTWAEEKSRADLPSDDRLDTDAPVPDIWASPSPHAGDTLSLERWLRTVAGIDAELLVAVLVYGETQKEAAARLGLTYEAARKKYRRAEKRLSHFLSKTGVFQMKGDRR
jgi:DNA-directed RNA polymerase specialized sigma24 family protein